MKKTFLYILLLFVYTVPLAQTEMKKLNTDINTSNSNRWYNTPLFWFAAAGIFIFLLIALIRSGSKKRNNLKPNTDSVSSGNR